MRIKYFLLALELICNPLLSMGAESSFEKDECAPEQKIVYTTWKEGDECIEKSEGKIIILKSAKDFNLYIKRCGGDRSVGYMINPAFISLDAAREIGFEYRGVLSAATIVMQIAYAATLRENNDLGTMFVVYGTPIEEVLSKAYISEQGIENVRLVPGKTEADIIYASKQILAENRAVVVFGSNGTPLTPLLRQVLFEELYPRESVMVGGENEEGIGYGIVGGIYVNKDKAKSMFSEAVRGCRNITINLKSPEVPPYMTAKKNKKLVESMGLITQ